MGIAIPQVITNRSGAQVIDGSLKFDDNTAPHLKKTNSSAGNQKKWTVSVWVKRANLGLSDTYIFNSSTTPDLAGAYFDSSDKLYFRGYASNPFTWRLQTS